jgi:hypothetical protein
LRRGDSEPSAEELQDVENEKWTMGHLFQFLRKEIELNAAEIAILTTSVRDRNFLSHDYWYRRLSLLATVRGCQELVAELQTMSERLKQANATAEAISRRVRAQAGIAEAVVRQVQDDFVKRLRQGESQDAIIKSQKRMLEKYRSD